VAFDVAKEAITNAVRHAQASVVLVSIEGGPTHLHVTVSDDGVGIPVDFVHGRPDRLGIAGMHELAAIIGACLHVAPRQPCGTRVALNWAEHSDGHDLHH
jgi:signal transduction histidine kinase